MSSSPPNSPSVIPQDEASGTHDNNDIIATGFPQVYNDIKLFVDELHAQFDNGKATPLTLYHRVLEKIQVSETDRIEKVLNGFTKFFVDHRDYILSSSDLSDFPGNAKIYLSGSEKIFINISGFVQSSVSDVNVRKTILNHLLVIGLGLEKDIEKAKEYSKRYESMNSDGLFDALKIDTSTNEGRVVGNLLEKVKDMTKNIKDTSNPLDAITGLMGSGAINDLFASMEHGGGINPKKMAKLFKNLIVNMIPDDDDDGESGGDGGEKK